MSAEKLREAAALMRERALSAKDVTGASDWHVSLRGMTHAGDYSVRSSGGSVCGDAAEEEAEHIASWHPAVALAVADALDATADYIELVVDGRHPGWKAALHHADAVATAYLGSEPC